MSFHGLYRTDEPPDGDFVRYIESLVGRTPSDVEEAAKELALRLDRHAPAARPSAARPSGARPPAPTPTAADRPGPGLRDAFSRVLVVIGGLLLGLGLIAPDALSMMPGIILLVAGLAIGRQAGRRARRPSTDDTA